MSRNSDKAIDEIPEPMLQNRITPWTDLALLRPASDGQKSNH